MLSKVSMVNRVIIIYIYSHLFYPNLSGVGIEGVLGYIYTPTFVNLT